MEFVAILILAVSGAFALGTAFNGGAYDRGYRDGYRFRDRMTRTGRPRDDGTFGY